MLDVVWVTLYFLHEVHKQAPALPPWVSPSFAGKGMTLVVFPWRGGYSTFFWEHPHLVESPTPWGPVKWNFPSALEPRGCRFLRQVQPQMLWGQIPKFQKDVYTLWAPAPRPPQPRVVPWLPMSLWSLIFCVFWLLRFPSRKAVLLNECTGDARGD